MCSSAAGPVRPHKRIALAVDVVDLVVVIVVVVVAFVIKFFFFF